MNASSASRGLGRDKVGRDAARSGRSSAGTELGRDEVGRDELDRDQFLAHLGQIGLTTFGMVSLLAGVGIVSRWSHLHAEVLSQPTALIGVAVGFLTVLTWLLFTLRCVRLARVGAVLAAVAAVGDLAVYATSIREPGSAPPVALAMLLVAFLVFQAIVLRAVDLPRGDTTDTTLPELSKPFALPFKVLAFGLAYSALWATLNNGAHLFNGRPLAAIHYGTAGLGFTVAGALSKRSTAASAALACWLLIASAAGTSMTDTVVSLALMLALVPAMLWLARHRAPTSPIEVPVNA